jgi:aspartate/methionine/tyrosine aminotransferase
MNRVLCSPYIEWAKLRSDARYNLATSALEHASLADLTPPQEVFELSGPGGYGYVPLVERIARRYDVASDCIVLGAGATMANYLAMATLLAPGDDVLLERPTYEPLLAAAASCGATIRRIERRAEDRFRIDPDAVAEAATSRTRLIVLANLHNPTSALLDRETLLDIGRTAERVGAHVLVDEVYLDAVFEDTPSPAFHLGPAFLTTNSLTKVYGLAGLRCGWILCEPALARRIWRFKDLVDNIPPHAIERLGVVAFDRLEHLRARSRTRLSMNRRLLAEFLAARLDLDVTLPRFGTTVCPRLPAGRVEELCAVLRSRYETSVVPGHFFEMPDYFRIGIGGPSDVLVEGLDRLGRALDDIALPAR